MIEATLLFWTQFIMMVAIVFGVVSIILAGSIFEPARVWWRKVFNKSILKDLSFCSMCLGLWISLAMQWLVIDYTNIICYILFSFASSGIVWVMYSFTQMVMWIKAYYENEYNEQKIEDTKEVKKIGYV